MNDFAGWVYVGLASSVIAVTVVAITINAFKALVVNVKIAWAKL